MTSLDVYVRERVEEVRSRLALLETSVITLKYDSWHVFNSFSSANITPPFIFPTSIFARLESRIDYIKRHLENIDPNNVVEINELSGFKKEIQGILVELNRLQDVFTQRISGLGLIDFTEFQPIQGIEYGNMAKAYNAVDALTFELVERILGKEWIRRNKYSPICLFAIEYAIDPFSFAISVPHYDNYRSRFWPALAHEVAHMFVDIKSSDQLFETILLDAIARLMEILGFEFSDSGGRYFCSMQVSEMTSDIIASYVCPPSFLTGAFFLNFASETAISLQQDLKECTHPPIDSRLTAMERVFEETGILASDEEVRRLVKSIHTFLRRNNTIVLSLQSQNLIKEYNRFARDYAEIILRMLPIFGLTPLNGVEWNQIADALNKQDLDDLTPIQLICASWLKRIRATEEDSSLLIHDYFQKRRCETKTFDNNIRLMYNYYREKIYKNILQSDIYDICINVN